MLSFVAVPVLTQEEVDYGRLSVTMGRYMRQLNKGVIRPPDLVVGSEFCCLDFSYDSVWLARNPAY